ARGAAVPGDSTRLGSRSPWGQNCRSSPLVSSAVPRCQAAYGSAKYTAILDEYPCRRDENAVYSVTGSPETNNHPGRTAVIFPLTPCRLRGVAALLLALACLPAASAAEPKDAPAPFSPADWPVYNHDLAGWRYNPAEKTLGAGNVGKLVEKWR